MASAEGVFPKAGNDPIYASELNQLATAKSVSQLAYQNVKSDAGNWENVDFLGADIFTDSNGAKNTISSKTAVYSNDAMICRINDEAGLDTTYDPDTLTNSAYAFDNDDSTYASKTGTGSTTGTLGKSFSSKNVFAVRIKATGYVSASYSNTATADASATIYLMTFDGTSWSTHSVLDTQVIANEYGSFTINLTYDEVVILNSNVQGVAVKVNTTYSSGDSSRNPQSHIYIYTLEYGKYSSSSTVTTSTIMNENVPQTISVYAKKDLPAGTSMNVDVSDTGGSPFTITGQSFDTAIDTSSFTGSNLALNFNMSTDNGSITPYFYGYGVNIIQ